MRILCLSSGGIDSSIMMYQLKQNGHTLIPLFVNYGQISYEMEWQACQEVCDYLSITPQKLDIPEYGKFISSGITNDALDVRKFAFHPGRNLMLLSVASSYGYLNSAYVIAIGLLEPYEFPDQTKEFIMKAQDAIAEALDADIRIMTPLIKLNKLDLLLMARESGFPIENTYYCYSGTPIPCGHCSACEEYLSAKNALDKEE